MSISLLFEPVFRPSALSVKYYSRVVGDFCIDRRIFHVALIKWRKMINKILEFIYTICVYASKIEFSLKPALRYPCTFSGFCNI
jgi:hypothetical protein